MAFCARKPHDTHSSTGKRMQHPRIQVVSKISASSGPHFCIVRPKSSKGVSVASPLSTPRESFEAGINSLERAGPGTKLCFFFSFFSAHPTSRPPCLCSTEPPTARFFGLVRRLPLRRGSQGPNPLGGARYCTCRVSKPCSQYNTLHRTVIIRDEMSA